MANASPLVVHAPEELRAACDVARACGKRVGLVPTMGALHDGHLALVEEARRHAAYVAVTIFVNPTQFGPSEDLSRYPRDLAGDVQKLARVGCDLVFAPDVRAMYPAGEETRVRVSALAEPLCGRSRPHHFEGVTTIVAKLWNIAGPCTAVFGKKDYQQLAVLRRMAADLFFPIEVVGHAIVREADGLAMSSRNAYLDPDERVRALALSRALSRCVVAFEAGERRAGALRALARAPLEEVAARIDYVEVADADRLSPIPDDAVIGERALVALACHVGKTRLIDNVVLGEDPAPNAQGAEGRDGRGQPG
jgi:pantoate--beta-alanine ligase